MAADNGGKAVMRWHHCRGKKKKKKDGRGGCDTGVGCIKKEAEVNHGIKSKG